MDEPTTYPPGPTFRSPFTAYMGLRRNPTGFLSNLAQTYGDACSFHNGRRRFFLFNHPDYIHEILVTHDRHFGKKPRAPASA